MTRASVLALGCAVLAAGCKERTPPQKARPEPAPNKMLGVVKQVLETCEVSDVGPIGTCRDPRVRQALVAAESDMGPALLGYCQAQSDGDARARLLAAYRLDAVHGRDRAWAGAEVFDCLVAALERAQPPIEQRLLARPAGYMAPLLRRVEPLLALVDHPDRREAERAVYDVLWANGRLAVLALLQRRLAARDTDARLRRIIVRSLGRGSSWTAGEAEAACGRLHRFAADSDPEVAGLTVRHLARACPGSNGTVLGALDRLQVDSNWLAAVEELGRRASAGTADAALRPRATQLLSRAVDDQRVAGAIRAAALRSLHALDPKAGLSLAKRLARDSKTVPVVARAAGQLLAASKPSAPLKR